MTEARGISSITVSFKLTKRKASSPNGEVVDNHGTAAPYKIITLNIARKGARQHIIKAVEDGLASGLHVFKIRLSSSNPSAFPNVCVQVAGILDYYKQKRDCKFLSTSSVRDSTYLYRTHFLSPMTYSPDGQSPTDFLDRVWRFSFDDEYQIVSGIVYSIRSKIRLESGVIESA